MFNKYSVVNMLPSRIFNLHVFSFLPGLKNPWWSEDGCPHAHCQLREEGKIRQKRVEEINTNSTWMTKIRWQNRKEGKTFIYAIFHNYKIFRVPLSMLTEKEVFSLFLMSLSLRIIIQKRQLQTVSTSGATQKNKYAAETIPVPPFLVGITLSNGKQPRLPVTQSTSSYYIVSCWTKYSLYKSLRSEKRRWWGEKKQMSAVTEEGKRKDSIEKKIIARDDWKKNSIC